MRQQRNPYSLKNKKKKRSDKSLVYSITLLVSSSSVQPAEHQRHFHTFPFSRSGDKGKTAFPYTRISYAYFVLKSHFKKIIIKKNIDLVIKSGLFIFLFI